MPPIPCPLFADLGGVQNVTEDVRINRKQAFVFNASKTNHTTSGDLLRVIGRDGTVKRSFTYQNNLMVSHTDAAGLTAYYEYSHYTPTGKVLRNWTSLGEEWRFTYHDGYTEVTDVLGRTEQYHYDYNNELTKRVFADGSAVLIERDNADRLTSHTDGEGHTTAYEAVILPIKIPSKHNIRR